MRHFAAPVAALALLILTACTLSAPATHEADTPDDASAVEEQVELNGHEVLDTAIGEPVTISFAGTEDVAVEFTVNSIQLDVKCTSEFAFPPTQGQFIALDITVTTAEDYEEISGNAPMRFFRNDFSSATASNSETVEAGSGVDCITGGLPLDIPAGTVTTGFVLLDVPLSAVSLVWQPSTFSIAVDGREWSLR